MRIAGIARVHRRRGRGCTRRDPTPPPRMVNRSSDSAGPDRLWRIGVTEHPTAEGQGVQRRRGRRLLPADRQVIDRRSQRAELVVDALQMAV